jgi:hypothetical protein
MPYKPLNQSGVAHYILPVIVVLAVAVIGFKVIAASHADPQTVNVVNADTTASGTATKNIAILDSTQAALGAVASQSSVPYSFIGTQTVNSLPAGGATLTYSQGVKGNETSCYEVYVSQPKSGVATATVEFANNNNTVTKVLKSNNFDNLQEVCVAPGTGTNPGFDVQNQTPSAQNTNIEVYRDIISWYS